MRSLCENLLDFSTTSFELFNLERSRRDMKNQKIVDTEIALDVLLLFIDLFFSYIFILSLKNSGWFFL